VGGESATQTAFGDLLAERVAERRSQIVLGIDPDPAALWPVEPASDGGPPLAGAVLAHCRALIDAVADACVAVKLQLACFERIGKGGWETTRAVVAHARQHGLLVIADGKRGDIDVSARAYASALGAGMDSPFGHADGIGADLVTINPLMGSDALWPFIQAARAGGSGVLVLVRTSNPGAADLQDLELASGGPVWEQIARLVCELGRDGIGQSGLSDVGAVLGATVPEHLERARELMPHTTFLLPGVGAQGGDVKQLGPAFAPGPAGGLITASRSIVGAHLNAGGEPAAAALAEAQRLRELARALT
jgi:orotidine-5'-phosphate decarboxylase